MNFGEAATDPRVVCPGCPCLCEDVTLRVQGDRIFALDTDCELGRQRLVGRGAVGVSAMVRGRPTDLPTAVAAAAELLRGAAAPAIVGLTGSTVEAVREAVALAETLRGLVCPWPTDPTRAWGLRSPDLTRTLGAVRAYCDLIIFWRCDPTHTHPRHRQRWSGGGMTVLIHDDPAPDGLSLEAALTLRRSRETDVDLLLRLRLQLETGAPVDGDAAALAELLSRSRACHVFVDPSSASNAIVMGQLQSLAAKLHGKVRMGVSVLPGAVSGRTATEVLTWQTGFAGPIDFADGAPRHRPGLLEADRVLREGRTDVVVEIGHVEIGQTGMSVPPQDTPARIGGTDIPVCPSNSGGTDIPVCPSRIVIAESPDPGAEVSFTAAALDPRMDAHVIRSDGIMLRLCGEGAGVTDPTAAILAELRRLLA